MILSQTCSLHKIYWCNSRMPGVYVTPFTFILKLINIFVSWTWKAALRPEEYNQHECERERECLLMIPASTISRSSGASKPAGFFLGNVVLWPRLSLRALWQSQVILFLKRQSLVSSLQTFPHSQQSGSTDRQTLATVDNYRGPGASF